MALIAIGIVASSAEARRRRPAPRPAAGRWVSGPAALQLAKEALGHCKALTARRGLPLPEELVEQGGVARVAARQQGSTLELRCRISGAGMDSATTNRHWRIDTGRCAAVGLSYEWPDQAAAVGVRFFTEGRPPTRARAKLFEAAGFVAAEPQSAGHAAARFIATLPPCPSPSTKSSAAKPLLPPRPAVAGKPLGSRSTIWTAAQLRAMGARPPRLGSGKRADALAVAAIGRPRRSRRLGRGGIELYHSTLGDKARTLLALYDRRRRHHRWILASGGCFVGQQPRWLGQRRGLLVGVAPPADPGLEQSAGRVLLVRLADGRVSAMPLVDAGGGVGDRISVRLRGDRLVLRSGRRRPRSVDLRPVLDRLEPPKPRP